MHYTFAFVFKLVQINKHNMLYRVKALLSPGAYLFLGVIERGFKREGGLLENGAYY